MKKIYLTPIVYCIPIIFKERICATSEVNMDGETYQFDSRRFDDLDKYDE